MHHLLVLLNLPDSTVEDNDFTSFHRLLLMRASAETNKILTHQPIRTNQSVAKVMIIFLFAKLSVVFHALSVRSSSFAKARFWLLVRTCFGSRPFEVEESC